MGLLDYILGFSSEAPSIFPHDANDERAWRSSGARDVWNSDAAGPSSTGTYVRSDDAIGVSCVFLGVRIYANLLGTSPVRFYRNRPKDEGEDQIYDHRLLPVLSADGRPNPWMTGAAWRMWTEAQATLWGLGLSEIKYGPEGLELWPIEAEHITLIEQLGNGKKRFTISEPGKPQRPLLQDEVFQVEGFGTHRLIPESLLRRSREAVAIWLAQQQYRGTYFERGASPSIIFQHPGTMSDPALKRFKTQVQGRVGGNRNAHRALVVEENMTVKEFGHTARNAQLVEAWDAQAVEIARWMGLPPYMFGVSKQPPYASREQATREFLDLHLIPKARLWEAAIKRDLIVERDIVCEIDLDNLKRGDALTQAQTDAIYLMNSVKSGNEVRRSLGLNSKPGLDEPTRAANLDRGGDPRQPRPDNPGDRETRTATGKPAVTAATDIIGMLDTLVPGHSAAAQIEAASARVAEVGPLPRTDDRARRVIEASARALLHQETEAVRRRAVQLAADPAAWSAWLSKFYRDHQDRMMDRLAVTRDQAQAYTEAHRRQLEREGVGVCDGWESNKSAVKSMARLGDEPE